MTGYASGSQKPLKLSVKMSQDHSLPESVVSIGSRFYGPESILDLTKLRAYGEVLLA